ncbi:MAG: hypothetical protein AAGD11_04170 [Planctomycetota bacterium]
MVIALPATVTFVGLVGCGSEFGASVSGKVTLDGKTITPGLVTFAPEDPTAIPSVGDLDSSGNFILTTSKKDGIRPGKYRASVQAFEPPDIPPGQRSYTPSEPLVPMKYMQVTTSGLEFTVESGSNTINIELTSD